MMPTVTSIPLSLTSLCLLILLYSEPTMGIYEVKDDPERRVYWKPFEVGAACFYPHEERYHYIQDKKMAVCNVAREMDEAIGTRHKSREYNWNTVIPLELGLKMEKYRVNVSQMLFDWIRIKPTYIPPENLEEEVVHIKHHVFPPKYRANYGEIKEGTEIPQLNSVCGEDTKCLLSNFFGVWGGICLPSIWWNRHVLTDHDIDPQHPNVEEAEAQEEYKLEHRGEIGSNITGEIKSPGGGTSIIIPANVGIFVLLAAIIMFAAGIP